MREFLTFDLIGDNDFTSATLFAMRSMRDMHFTELRMCELDQLKAMIIGYMVGYQLAHVAMNFHAMMSVSADETYATKAAHYLKYFEHSRISDTKEATLEDKNHDAVSIDFATDYIWSH